jgi:hypothetical protein
MFKIFVIIAENQTRCRWDDSKCFAKVATEIVSRGKNGKIFNNLKKN